MRNVRKTVDEQQSTLPYCCVHQKNRRKNFMPKLASAYVEKSKKENFEIAVVGIKPLCCYCRFVFCLDGFF
jgi:hypothetical protein